MLTNESGLLNCRVVVIGESSVGKTSMAKTFTSRGTAAIENVETTIGAAFLTHTILVDGQYVKFDIWDTAGQERFHSLTPMYYRGAQGAIVVYDITDPDTFDRAHYWVKELRRQADSEIVVALSGNKADLEDQREVSEQHGKSIAEDNGLLFMETSAKTAHNIDELFIAIGSGKKGEVFCFIEHISKSFIRSAKNQPPQARNRETAPMFL